MSEQEFVDHIAFLSQLSEVDLANLYANMAANGPWPYAGDQAIDPLALIVHAVTGLVQRLAPDDDVGKHLETSAVARAVGVLLYQLSALGMVARIAMTPIGEENAADTLMGRLGIDITRILTMDYNVASDMFFVAGVVAEEEEGNGKAETTGHEG